MSLNGVIFIVAEYGKFLGGENEGSSLVTEIFFQAAKLGQINPLRCRELVSQVPTQLARKYAPQAQFEMFVETDRLQPFSRSFTSSIRALGKSQEREQCNRTEQLLASWYGRRRCCPGSDIFQGVKVIRTLCTGGVGASVQGLGAITAVLGECLAGNSAGKIV